MKQGKRLYVSLTNDCTTSCPFCCMNSGEGKKTYLTFDVYRSIVDACELPYELQLEGGEPLIHPSLWLFVEYGLSTGRCKKLIVVTNGKHLDEFLERLVIVRKAHPQIEFEVKVSLNYWLLKEDEGLLPRVERALFATQYIPNLSLLLNVRERVSDDYTPLLEERGLLEHSNVYKLQSYGKLEGSKAYAKPVIVQNIQEWELFGSDGKSFGQDLIARADAEKELE